MTIWEIVDISLVSCFVVPQIQQQMQAHVTYRLAHLKISVGLDVRSKLHTSTIDTGSLEAVNLGVDLFNIDDWFPHF